MTSTWRSATQVVMKMWLRSHWLAVFGTRRRHRPSASPRRTCDWEAPPPRTDWLLAVQSETLFASDQRLNVVANYDYILSKQNNSTHVLYMYMQIHNV